LGLAGVIVMADNWVVSPILPAISNNLGIDIARYGLESLFIIYGVALVFTLLISFALIRDKVVEDDESKEEIGNL